MLSRRIVFSFEQRVLLWLPYIGGCDWSFGPSLPICFGRETTASCIWFVDRCINAMLPKLFTSFPAQVIALFNLIAEVEALANFTESRILWSPWTFFNGDGDADHGNWLLIKSLLCLSFASRDPPLQPQGNPISSSAFILSSVNLSPIPGLWRAYFTLLQYWYKCRSSDVRTERCQFFSLNALSWTILSPKVVWTLVPVLRVWVVHSNPISSSARIRSSVNLNPFDPSGLRRAHLIVTQKWKRLVS